MEPIDEAVIDAYIERLKQQQATDRQRMTAIQTEYEVLVETVKARSSKINLVCGACDTLRAIMENEQETA